jgi:hypothetical protein
MINIIESVHSGEFPLHHKVDNFCTSEIVKFLRVLLTFGKCYAQNTRFTTVIIDKPTGHQRYIIE